MRKLHWQRLACRCADRVDRSCCRVLGPFQIPQARRHQDGPLLPKSRHVQQAVEDTAVRSARRKRSRLLVMIAPQCIDDTLDTCVVVSRRKALPSMGSVNLCGAGSASSADTFNGLSCVSDPIQTDVKYNNIPSLLLLYFS